MAVLVAQQTCQACLISLMRPSNIRTQNTLTLLFAPPLNLSPSCSTTSISHPVGL